MTNIFDRAAQIAQAADKERLQGDEALQKGRALRFPNIDIVRVYNNSGEYLFAYRFAMIQEYDPDTRIYSIVKPIIYDNGLSFLSAGHLVMLEQDIAVGHKGWAFIRGVHKILVLTSTPQNIIEGDSIGAEAQGKAIKLGPFTCLRVDGDYVYVRAD